LGINRYCYLFHKINPVYLKPKQKIELVTAIYKFFLSLFLVLVVAIAYSQSVVEGIIVKDANEEAVPFATISVQNKAVGTITNIEGKFKLDIHTLQDTDTIQISHLSYNSLRITLASLKSNQGKIRLYENTLMLREVTVNAAQNDIDLLEDIITQSKKKLILPLTYNIYYREWVKENASYNRFADGLLTIAYPLNKEDLKVQVNQSRAFKLPKDDDEIFDMVSPVKLEYVLNYVYIDFLNRFRGEKGKDYNVTSYQGPSFDDFYTITIAPKKGVVSDDSRLLHNVKLKVDQDRAIREVEIKSDSLSSFEKSFLGLKSRLLESKTTLSFKRSQGQNHLAYARFEFKLRFTFKKKVQISVYTSEFVLLDAANQETEIPHKDQFKKSALFKNGNKYTTNFWEGLEMPLLSEDERKVIELLATKSNDKTLK